MVLIFTRKLINNSCSCYPTKTPHSGQVQVDKFKKPNEKRVEINTCSETISNCNIFVNLHVHRARTTHLCNEDILKR